MLSEPVDSAGVVEAVEGVPANAVVEPVTLVEPVETPNPRPPATLAPPAFAVSVRVAVAVVETELELSMCAPPSAVAESPSCADCELESVI
jgi:hypothetical protein